MSAYDNDPRVDPLVPDCEYRVETGRGLHIAYRFEHGEWYTVDHPNANTGPVGPYPTGDAAIASLIGDPQ